MYQEKDLKPYSVWHHLKSGGLYVVLGIATCSTNGSEASAPVVVYWSTTYKHLCYRDQHEFLDGRFKPVESDVRL